MNIADALYVGITDNQFTPGSEGTTPQSIIAGLRQLYPSEAAAAKAAGVPRSTWRRWARGATPKAGGFARLQAAQRRARLPREREAWMRHGHIVVDGILAFSGEEEPFRRLVTDWGRLPGAAAHEQPPGMQGRILDAWLAADDLRAVDALMGPLHAGLNEHADKDIELQVVDIYSIRWFKTRGEALQAMRLRRM